MFTTLKVDKEVWVQRKVVILSTKGSERNATYVEAIVYEVILEGIRKGTIGSCKFLACTPKKN